MLARRLFLIVLYLVAPMLMGAPVVMQVAVQDSISPVIASYIDDALKAAQAKQAQALIIELDTPGGLIDSTRHIVQSILKSKVPVVVYVSPRGARAASAGMFITMAAHVAAMAPSTHIGASHPVTGFGADIEGEMGRKVENDTAAFARSLAQQRSRNADWAEKAVRKSESISAEEAVNKHVVDFIAQDIHQLLKFLDGRVVQIDNKKHTILTTGTHLESYEMTGQQQFMHFLSNPDLLFLLMLLGFLGVFLEFQHPGLILPGLLGAVCLLVVFGIQVLPVNWIGMLLILGAVALLVAEIYITSFGLLAIGGVGLLVAGSYLLFNVPGSTFQINPILIWTFSLLFASILAAFGYLILRTRRQGPTSGVATMIGEICQVIEPISPNHPGSVFALGSRWQAFSGHTIEHGVQVRIIRVESTRVYVEPIDLTEKL